MPEGAGLDSLVVELRGLRGGDRRAILAALSAAERAKLAAFIDSPAPTQRTAARPLAAAVSPWLNDRIGGSSAGTPWQISPAARSALAAAARDLGADADTAGQAGNARGRSLAGAVADLLTRPRR